MIKGQNILVSTLVLIPLILGGCMAKEVANHSFEFNARDDSPNIEILNYKYQHEGHDVVSASQWKIEQGMPLGGTNINASMLRGDTLYVKWRIKATGEVLEDSVDLRERLPRNIEGCRIHFVVKEKQLYIYLISPKPNPDRFIKPPLSMYAHLKVDEIYPAQPKF